MFRFESEAGDATIFHSSNHPSERDLQDDEGIESRASTTLSAKPWFTPAIYLLMRPSNSGTMPILS